MDLHKELARVGLALPDIYLPSSEIDYQKYAVIACDQYSAQPEYWREVEDFVGRLPSALKLILPEAFLNRPNGGDEICTAMGRYLEEGLLRKISQSFVFVRRQTSAGVRRGLIAAFDLEQYSFLLGSRPMIRATEETVAERLPARVEIRKKAPLELPHVMVLIDDPADLLMAALEAMALPALYNFPLMKGGGWIRGFAVRGAEHLVSIARILQSLPAPDSFLYAMGDGNHSFAAAKISWDELKKGLSSDERKSHPARFCLAEIVNLHDPALNFEPIHRLLISVDAEAVQRDLGFDAASPPDLQDFQPRLDDWLRGHPETVLEYIHGEQDCRSLGAKKGNLAIIFPPFNKSGLFATVAERGIYARKSFSMGHSNDKRFYLEARKIR